MLTDTIADSRAAATMMPTGPTAAQIKERAIAAGTDGPPSNATTRSETTLRTRDSGERPIIFDRGNGTTGLVRSIVENKMPSEPESDDASRTDAGEGPNNRASEKAAQRRAAEMAKAAFAETQAIAREAQAERTASKKEAM